MFNKNNTKIKPENEFLGSVKLHTMKDDIAGESQINLTQNSDIENKKLQEDSEIKGGSPFLSSATPLANNSENVIGNMSGKTENNPGFPNFEKINIENNANSPDEKLSDRSEMGGMMAESNKKSYGWFYAVIVLMIILLGAGGYYFWFFQGEKNVDEIATDQNGSNKTSELNTSNSTKTDSNSNPINDLSDNKSLFSDKVNFMVISDENFDQAGIKAVIDDKFVEMEKYAGKQLEFLMVDQNNTPILFKDFIDNFGLSLKPEIINSLSENNFSLFLYRDNNVKRIDLVIEMKNVDLAKMNLAKNEKTLVSDFNPLFMYDKPETVTKQFSESNYNGKIIRYVNLNKDSNLSLDYSIVGNYLLIATNKESGRLIIDKLSNESSAKKDVFAPENE